MVLNLITKALAELNFSHVIKNFMSLNNIFLAIIKSLISYLMSIFSFIGVYKTLVTIWEILSFIENTQFMI